MMVFENKLSAYNLSMKKTNKLGYKDKVKKILAFRLVVVVVVIVVFAK